VATKKVKAGDYVKLDSGEEGYVVDIDWRHTSLRTLPNNMVMIPNSQLVDSVLTNYNYPFDEMSIVVGVGVSYASDLEHVERVTLEVATQLQRELEQAVDDFEPFVRFHTFGDSSIDMNVILRPKHVVDQYPLIHEFVKRLHRRFNEEGIVIPFPIRTIDWPDAPKRR
jgi:small-conductance mechanosensitive channel